MKIIEIYNVLDGLEDKKITFLEADNNFQLLIGVIMSAQTTDRQVNEILPDLFRRYAGPEELAGARKSDVIDIIRSTGFFNNKAANIIETARIVHEDFADVVPAAMDDLLKLAGVGRKTANVIRGACFGLPAIIVDTHFSRTVQRLGLTVENTPEKIERDFAAKLPGEIQYRFSMLLNKFGRDYCKAKSPLCGDCPVEAFCGWEFKDPSRSSRPTD